MFTELLFYPAAVDIPQCKNETSIHYGNNGHSSKNVVRVRFIGSIYDNIVTCELC